MVGTWMGEATPRVDSALLSTRRWIFSPLSSESNEKVMWIAPRGSNNQINPWLCPRCRRCQVGYCKQRWTSLAHQKKKKKQGEKKKRGKLCTTSLAKKRPFCSKPTRRAFLLLDRACSLYLKLSREMALPMLCVLEFPCLPCLAQLISFNFPFNLFSSSFSPD